MNYQPVLRHIEALFGACGESARLSPLGDFIPSQERIGCISISIRQAVIQENNGCFEVIPPHPKHPINPPGGYIVNRIRLSTSMIGDYANGAAYTNEELRNYLDGNVGLFGYYEQ